MKKRYRKLLLELWTEALLSVGARKVNGKWDLCAGKPEVDSFSAYDEDLVSHAHHEAGHCVVAKALGYRVQAATLSRGPACSAGSMWSNVLGDSERGAEAARRKIVVLVAGAIAQALYDAAAKTEGGSDFLEATAEARKVVGLLENWQAVDQELERARASAALVLRQNWDHVLRTAENLLRFHAAIDRIPLQIHGDDGILPARQGASVDPCDEKHCLDGGAL